MKTTKRSRTKNFNTRLAAYSATAGAALLAAPAADATIQNITGLSVSLDLTLNGGNESLSFNAGPFQASFIGTRGQSTSKHHAYNNTYTHVRRVGDASIHGYLATTGYGPVARLNKGDLINSINRDFNLNTNRLAYRDVTNDQTRSFSGSIYVHPPNRKTAGLFVLNANSAQTGYIGFKTAQGGHSYYGWLRVKVTSDANGLPDQISLVDNGNGIYGAFGLKSDNITAGEVAPVPEPSVAAIGGLGLLALGAAGVREMRRRRKA